MDMIEIVTDLVLVVYLLSMAIIDCKRKAIPILPGVVCLIIISVVRLVSGVDPITVGSGICLGGVLYGISRISKGEIGEADALVYAVTGAALGIIKNCELLLVSLVLAAVIGVILMVIKKVGRKYRLPFVPFTLVSFGMVMFL